ncbi:MAG: MlaD family protein [Candidatus Gastranaerophilales bacterium]|nr:MlaD family protein [Candidatus Gastranaerophilales bacterium]
MKKSHFAEIIILAIFLGTFVFAGFKLVQNLFDYGKVYHLVFKDIDRIEIGSPVRIMGVDIGHVTKIHTIYDEIYVDFVVLNPDITIPSGTVASIQFSGLAGSRSIELSPPSFAKGKAGLIVEEPIRISAAMDVSKSFIKATMMTAKGLSTFIGDRNYQEVKAQTQKFKNETAKLNRDVKIISNNIEQGGTTLRHNMKNANVIMGHSYNYAENINDTVNFPKILSVAKYSKQSLKNYTRLIDSNRKAIRRYCVKTGQICKKTDCYIPHMQRFSRLNTNTEKFRQQAEVLDSKITTQNLEKLETNMEKAKTVTQKINNAI